MLFKHDESSYRFSGLVRQLRRSNFIKSKRAPIPAPAAHSVGLTFPLVLQFVTQAESNAFLSAPHCDPANEELMITDACTAIGTAPLTRVGKFMMHVCTARPPV